MVAVHTIGTRSLANVRHDMVRLRNFIDLSIYFSSIELIPSAITWPQEKRKGRKVSRAEVFKVAYTRKDGRPQPAHEVTIVSKIY